MFDRPLFRILLIAIATVPAARALGDSVVGSQHDLSQFGSQHACVFCHTPHQASLAAFPVPTWSRVEATQNFPVYGNVESDGGKVAPGVVTRLCLSCHDGVNAKGVAYGAASPRPCRDCAPGHPLPARQRSARADFRGGHPVALPNPTPEQSPDFRMPPDPGNGWARQGEDDVKLFNGAVECGSCHNAHNPRITPFLRTSNSGEAMCLRCHRK